MMTATDTPPNPASGSRQAATGIRARVALHDPPDQIGSIPSPAGPPPGHAGPRNQPPSAHRDTGEIPARRARTARSARRNDWHKRAMVTDELWQDCGDRAHRGLPRQAPLPDRGEVPWSAAVRQPHAERHLRRREAVHPDSGLGQVRAVGEAGCVRGACYGRAVGERAQRGQVPVPEQVPTDRDADLVAEQVLEPVL